jgi:hypothetical protein
MDTQRFITVLRLAAVALVVTGFIGWATGESDAFSLDSLFTVAFLLGVACAVASVYLGVFLANRSD